MRPLQWLGELAKQTEARAEKLVLYGRDADAATLYQISEAADALALKLLEQEIEEIQDALA